MLQANEIQRRFQFVELAIGQAAQACSAERNVPSELRDCLQRLDRQSDLTRLALQSHDEAHIRKMVGDLEQLGQRARRVCASGAALTLQLRSAVLHMHTQLSELKHELH